MKLQITIIVTLLLYTINSFGQQTKIDSLKNELANSKNDLKRVEVLEILTGILINETKPKESLPYFQKFAAIANKLKLDEKESRAYKYISECYIRFEDFKKAEEFALKALKISSLSKDTNFYLLDINQLGRVYHHFQKYQLAIDTYSKGIKKYNSNPSGNAIATIYSNLGISYSELGDTNKMINSYLKAAEYADKLGNYNAKSSSLYNIGSSYMDLEQYEKAEKYFLNGLKDSLNVTLKVYVNIHYHALGLTYSRWGKYQKALKYNFIALKNFQEVGNELYEFDVLNNIATVYSRMNNVTKSIEYAKKALQLAEKLQHKLAINGAKQTLASNYINIKKYNEAEKLLLEIIKDTSDVTLIRIESKAAILQNLSDVYKSKGDFKQSLLFFEKFKITNDSIIIQKRDSKVTEIETKYQTEKKEAENNQLKAEKAAQTLILQKENTQKWFLGGGLGTSIITLFIFGFYYQRNKKQKIVIENLQKELHHRVKNNLGIIDTFIEVAKDEFNNEQFQNKLTELQNRIASINEIHQQLYVNKDVTQLNLNKYITTLTTTIKKSFSNDNVEIIREIDPKLIINAAKSFPIGLIVNEFITNSYKYAFNENTAGKIEVSIFEDSKNYYLNLKDNGKGLPNDFKLDESNTFGLRIIKLLTNQLNGDFNLKNENGVVLAIQFSK